MQRNTKLSQVFSKPTKLFMSAILNERWKSLQITNYETNMNKIFHCLYEIYFNTVSWLCAGQQYFGYLVFRTAADNICLIFLYCWLFMSTNVYKGCTGKHCSERSVSNQLVTLAILLVTTVNWCQVFRHMVAQLSFYDYFLLCMYAFLISTECCHNNLQNV